MRKTFWSHPTSWEEVKKRAAGRAKYNALRRLNAQLRRRQVLQLLGEIGWTYGSQAMVARQLGVSEATISRDMATILPLYRECAHCGSLVPRVWFAEEYPLAYDVGVTQVSREASTTWQGVTTVLRRRGVDDG